MMEICAACGAPQPGLSNIKALPSRMICFTCRDAADSIGWNCAIAHYLLELLVEVSLADHNANSDIHTPSDS